MGGLGHWLFISGGGSDGVLGEHELHQGCLLTFYLKKNIVLFVFSDCKSNTCALKKSWKR